MSFLLSQLIPEQLARDLSHALTRQYTRHVTYVLVNHSCCTGLHGVATLKTKAKASTPLRPHKPRNVVARFRRKSRDDSPSPSANRDGAIDPLSESSKRSMSATPRSKATTEALEEELRWIAHEMPHPKPIRNILEILVERRLVKPGPLHYEALILGNCNPEHGSAANVRDILQEMEQENMTIGAQIYHAVLKVSMVFSWTW